MQIIDELEVNRRGPYGGGVGVVSFNGAPLQLGPSLLLTQQRSGSLQKAPLRRSALAAPCWILWRCS